MTHGNRDAHSTVLFTCNLKKMWLSKPRVPKGLQACVSILRSCHTKIPICGWHLWWWPLRQRHLVRTPQFRRVLAIRTAEAFLSRISAYVCVCVYAPVAIISVTAAISSYDTPYRHSGCTKN